MSLLREIQAGLIEANADIAERSSKKPIWWVDPADEPTQEIESLLKIFRCPDNFLPADSERFFSDLAQELAPAPHPQGKDVAYSRELIRGFQQENGVKKSTEERELRLLRQTQEHEFETKVNDVCAQYLNLYIDHKKRSILNWLAYQNVPLASIHLGDFGTIIRLLSRGAANIGYHCARVALPPVGSVELALQPSKGERGEGLEHESWFDVVAAVLFFRTVNQEGFGIGECEVWAALTHRIEFPGNPMKFQKLRTWLQDDVSRIFHESLSRLKEIRRGIE